LSNEYVLLAIKVLHLLKTCQIDSVKLLIKKLKQKNPFTNGRSGRHWFEAFLKRFEL